MEAYILNKMEDMLESADTIIKDIVLSLSETINKELDKYEFDNSFRIYIMTKITCLIVHNYCMSIQIKDPLDCLKDIGNLVKEGITKNLNANKLH